MSSVRLVLLSLLAVSVYLNVRGPRRDATNPVAAEPPPARVTASRVGGQVPAPAPPPGTCPAELLAAEVQLERGLHALVNRVPAARLFQLGRLNASAEAALSDVIEPLLAQSSLDKEVSELACRGPVCRLTLVEGDRPLDEGGLALLRPAPDLGARVVSIDAPSLLPGYDPVGRRASNRWQVYMTLQRSDGQAPEGP